MPPSKNNPMIFSKVKAYKNQYSIISVLPFSPCNTHTSTINQADQWLHSRIIT